MIDIKKLSDEKVLELALTAAYTFAFILRGNSPIGAVIDARASAKEVLKS